MPNLYEQATVKLARNGGDPGILTELKNRLQVVVTRLGLLKQDKAALELASKFQRYIELSQQQHTHFTQLAALDQELETLQARRAELIEQRSNMETDNHVPAHQRIKLRVELNRHPRYHSRLDEVDKQYRVKGYN